MVQQTKHQMCYHGDDPIPAKARADVFKQKKALWAENDKEIRLELDKKEKVKNIEMPKKNRKKLPSRSHTFGCEIMVQIPLPDTGQYHGK